MFRGAVRADMAKILEIYARARDLMAKNGNPTQWGDNYPSPELLEEDIDTNRLFVYMINGRMQAVFAFILGEDPTYKVIEDGHWLNDTLPYGTLHRLASAGESKGVGKAVVEWCLEHCESLRADTHADNKVMQHLLESEGFTRCGIIHVEDGTPAHCLPADVPDPEPAGVRTSERIIHNFGPPEHLRTLRGSVFTGGEPLPSSPAAMPPSPRGRLQRWRATLRHCQKAPPWGSWRT